MNMPVQYGDLYLFEVANLTGDTKKVLCRCMVIWCLNLLYAIKVF